MAEVHIEICNCQTRLATPMPSESIIPYKSPKTGENKKEAKTDGVFLKLRFSKAVFRSSIWLRP